MVEVPLMTGAEVQMNRIIKASLPGPAFAPGVTKDGGMFKYKIKDWYKIEEIPEPDDDQWARRQNNIEPPSFINKTLWPDNVPLGYPFRKIEYDEGVTMARKPQSFSIMGTNVDSNFVTMMIGFVVVLFIVSKIK